MTPSTRTHPLPFQQSGGGGNNQAHRFGGRDVRGYQAMPQGSFANYPPTGNNNMYQPHHQMANPNMVNPAATPYGQHGMAIDHPNHASSSSSSAVQGAMPHYMPQQQRGGPAAAYGGGQQHMGMPYAAGSTAMDGQQQQSGVGGGYQGEGGGYNPSYGSSTQPTRGGVRRDNLAVPGSPSAAVASSGSAAAAGGSGNEEFSAAYSADSANGRAGSSSSHSSSPAGRGGMHGGYLSNRQQGTVTASSHPFFSPYCANHVYFLMMD